MRTYSVAKILRAVDGDTFDINIDLGFSIYHLVRIRIKGIDTEELNDPDPVKAAKAFAQKAFAQKLEGKLCSVDIHHTDKYGRWESDLFVDGIKYVGI